MKIISLNRLSVTAVIVFFVVVLSSCQKESSLSDSVTEEQATSYSEESTTAEASFDDAGEVAMTAADEENNASEFGINGRFSLHLLSCVYPSVIAQQLRLLQTTVRIPRLS